MGLSGEDLCPMSAPVALPDRHPASDIRSGSRSLGVGFVLDSTPGQDIIETRRERETGGVPRNKQQIPRKHYGARTNLNRRGDVDDLKQAVEAVLFVSDEPLSVQRIRDLVPDAGMEEVRVALDDLRREYEASGRAFGIEEIAGGYQLLTRPRYADIIARLRKARADRKLSAAAMETLAIIAYKQPIRRVDIEAIRGVQSGEILRALMERNLVRIVGRDTAPGTPVLYGTSKEFLDVFGLNSIQDLPKPEEVK